MEIFGVTSILLLGAWMILQSVADRNARMEIELLHAQVKLLSEEINRLNCSEDSDCSCVRGADQAAGDEIRSK